MKKYFALLMLLLVCSMPLFAAGGAQATGQPVSTSGSEVIEEVPAKNNFYGYLGYDLYNDDIPLFGLGYERALGSSFSLGGYLGLTGSSYEVVLKPRVYFGSALEKFFLGANVSLSIPADGDEDNNNSGGSSYYESSLDMELFIGPYLGYKFVFGNSSGGFSLEPSIGLDYGLLEGKDPRINLGVSVGYAWGGTTRAVAVPVAPPPPQAVPDGIYVGIVTFGPDATDITNGPIHLDQAGDGLRKLSGLVHQNYRRATQSGTAMFYADHLALANMKKAEPRLPQNLETATVITFTDGLDNQSTGPLARIDDPGNRSNRDFMGQQVPYMAYIKEQMLRRTINGQKITSYVASVQGDDITDVTAFDNTLTHLTDDPDNIWKEESISALDSRFREIAQTLVDELRETTFTMVTPFYPAGTRVRMTFNGESGADEAENAIQYLEGTIAVRNEEYYLTNIRYSGGINSLNTEIKGEIRNMALVFEFPLFSGFDFSGQFGNLLKQFRIYSGDSIWQPNSEYQVDPETVQQSFKKNALFYLVLDQSNSIKAEDIPAVQRAVESFIRILHEAYW